MTKFLILTILAIFLVPISAAFPLHGTTIWWGQYLVLLFCIHMGISLLTWRLNKYLAIFTILCLLSTFFVTRTHPRSMALLFQLNLSCLAVYGISMFNANQRRKILYAIVAFVIVQFVFSILQAYNLDPFFNSLIIEGKDEIVGFSGSKDQYGTFFALTLPVMLYFSPLLCLISFSGLFASLSSFAFVSAVIGGFICILYKIKNKFLIFLGIVIISLPLFFKVENLRLVDFQTRFSVWEHSIKSLRNGEIRIVKDGKKYLIKTNPIFGYGLGNFQRIFPYVPRNNRHFNFEGEKFTHAHNDYVEHFIFELGYIGIISLLLLIGGFLKSYIHCPKDKELTLYFSCVVVYLLNAMGNFVSQIAVSGMLLIIFYGMYEGRRREL